MSCREQLWPAAVLAVLLAPAALWAQDPGAEALMGAPAAGRPAISAHGLSVVQRKPTQLRMYLQLSAKGKTLTEALAKLKERREAAAARLETLNADKKSIVFGSPSMAAADSPNGVLAAQRRQIEMMISQQMRNRGKKAAKVQPPRTVAVTATMVAGWPLDAQTPEQLLVMVERLQEQVKAADLAGAKAVEKLSPEEEEMAEEANQMMANNYGGEQPAAAGEPQFVYVAVLPKAEREKAMAEAFARAKLSAAELAKAADVKLGPLVGLSGSWSGDASFAEEFYNRYGRPSGREFIQRFVTTQDGGDGAERPEETMNADPAGLKFTCHASAQFQLGK